MTESPNSQIGARDSVEPAPPPGARDSVEPSPGHCGPTTPPALDRQLAHRLTKWSLGAGLCAFIPVPFLDDWANARVRSAMNSALLRDASVTLTGPQYHHLVHGPPNSGGCLRILLRLPIWIAKWLIWYPIKKVLRKILFIFTVHDAVNAVSHAFHHGFLLQIALADGWQPDHDGAAGELHEHLDAVCRSAESRPVIKLIRIAFRRGHHGFRRQALRLYRRLRRSRRDADATTQVEASVTAESDSLDDLATNLENTFMTQSGYFDALARKLRQRLAPPPLPPPKPKPLPQ